jgi:Uncharacterized proteins, LmbE homologs
MKLLVVSPHPDDETLGAGGTILRYKKEGHRVYWLNITDVTSELGYSANFIEHRKFQITQINNFYGFDGFYNLKLPSTMLSTLEEHKVISKIFKVFDEVQPDWIIIPGRYDAHSDHIVVHDCCMACTKVFRAPYLKTILTMEILSETDFGYRMEKFSPNLFIDVTNEIDKKLDAMMIYDTEIEEPPFPRNANNIKALALNRGGQSGCMYAEAFGIVKMIK